MLRLVPVWTSSDADIIAPRHRADIVVDVIDDEGLLFDPTTGRTHRLNQTALFAWQCCDGRTTTRQIARWLSEHYDVTRERALDHVEQLLVLFAEGRLIETGAAA